MSETQSLSKPPPGSKIEGRRPDDDSVELLLPKRGFSGCADIFSFLFAIILVMFLAPIGLISSLAMTGSSKGIFTIVISLGVFVYGIYKFVSTINDMNMSEMITVKGDTLTRSLYKPIGSGEKVEEFNLQDISRVKLVRERKGRGKNIIEKARIDAGNKKMDFFSNGEGIDKRWAVKFLDALIKQKRNSQQ